MRFAKNRHRHRALSQTKRQRRLKGANDEDTEERKEHSAAPHMTYSPFDPANPNYSYRHGAMDDDEEESSSSAEEGFSTDRFYVPFRVNKARTKRKPDAPFMAMFMMYAQKDSNRRTHSQRTSQRQEEDEDEDEDG